MTLPTLFETLRLPIVGAPMFLASTPNLVIAQCRAGVLGAIPALNARSADILDEWLGRINQALAADRPENRLRRPAPFAVNLIVSPQNDRLAADLALCAKHRVPLVITSVGAPGDVARHVHGYGGMLFHDVASVRHARKAAQAGVDGLVVLAAGAGGHGGWLNPFAFVSEVRRIFDGVIVLAGGLSSGADVMAACLAGADLAYLGTRFLGTQECEIDDEYKQMLLRAGADDIVNTALFSGMKGNYLAASIARTGLDPLALPEPPRPGVGTGGHGEFKLWKHIWAAGHGVGSIDALPSVEDLIGEMSLQWQAAGQQATNLIRLFHPSKEIA
jgi:nitronate monooxygenase